MLVLPTMETTRVIGLISHAENSSRKQVYIFVIDLIIYY